MRTCWISVALAISSNQKAFATKIAKNSPGHDNFVYTVPSLDLAQDFAEMPLFTQLEAEINTMGMENVNRSKSDAHDE